MKTPFSEIKTNEERELLFIEETKKQCELLNNHADELKKDFHKSNKERKKNMDDFNKITEYIIPNIVCNFNIRVCFKTHKFLKIVYQMGVGNGVAIESIKNGMGFFDDIETKEIDISHLNLKLNI
ncbi:MAG: hypothetical protein GY849_02260 [Deltaproteobacteria bacterium]|nr:hypothetical protein [Deltaproteobacteria bacterium]